MARLELRHIRKTFGGTTALKDVSLQTGEGAFFVLL
jgi:ABC-type Fe3+/spermidine/putrescine transport system ATPase subunit